MSDDVTTGELGRRLDGLAEVLRAVDDRTRAMDTRAAVMEQQLGGHIDAQLRRTAGRDITCADHRQLIRGLEARVVAVEASQALDAGGRRSWYGIAQTVASVSALGGVVVLLWRG